MLAYIIAGITLLIFMVLIHFLGTWLHLSGYALWMLRGALWIIAIAAVGVFAWFWHKAHKKDEAEQETSAESADHTLIQDALKHLRASSRKGSAHLGDLPILIMLGESSSAKTTTVIRSGLDPDLLAGHVYQDDVLLPTETANIWYTRSALLLDVGGALLGETERLGKLVHSLERSSFVRALKQRKQSPRAVVACISVETFLSGQSADLAARARRLNAALQQVANSLGVNVPVYVFFNKLDRIASFADYVRDLNTMEANQVLGATIPFHEQQTGGVYAEQQAKLLTRYFDEISFGLADKRMDFLARVSEPQRLSGVYEFPRDFRKLRTSVVQFLVDALRPSHSPTNPLLRGFYFCGVRAVLEEQAGPAVAQSVPPASDPAAREATMFFNAAAMKAAAHPAPAPVPQTRKVPQWTFLQHLFSDVILRDRAAMGMTGASTHVNVARRIGIALLALLLLVLCIGFTVSFFTNRAMREDIASTAKALPSGTAGDNAVPSLQELQRLDELRNQYETLQGYNRDGAPLSMRWWLYSGEDLEAKARAIYFDRFYGMLLAPTEARLLSTLQRVATNPLPADDYPTTYDTLKAYLITTSNHDKSTKEFLGPALYSRWEAKRGIDPARAQLIRKQFDFYADQLKNANPYTFAAQGPVVDRARTYLHSLGTEERIYQNLITDANAKAPAIRFNVLYPGSAEVLVESHEVPGAFTKPGFAIVQDGLHHLDRYIRGEEWVLGPANMAGVDINALQQKLSARYQADYAKEWYSFLHDAKYHPFQVLPSDDAEKKLSQLAGATSPILELLATASQNTAVDDKTIADRFQPTQAVEPPGAVDQNKFIQPSNQQYAGSLGALGDALKVAALNPAIKTDPAPGLPVHTAAGSANAAVRTIAQTFTIDREGHSEKVVQDLLTEPIKEAEALVNIDVNAPANAAGKGLCAAFAAIAGKYPFAANSSQEATLDDLNKILAPGQALAAFYDNPAIKPVVTRQGNQAVPVPGAHVNPPFLQFLNRLTGLSGALYPGSATAPKFSYTLRQSTKNTLDGLAITIDGQTLTGSGVSNTFNWPGVAQQGVRLSGKIGTVASWDGLWGVFRFTAEAKQQASGGITELQLPLTLNNHPVTDATGAPVVVRYELQAGSAVPVASMFAVPRCVAEVAK